MNSGGMPGGPGHSATTREIVNAMTVDVEEYFQVSAFAHCVSRADWDSLPSRIEDSMRRLLELLGQHGAGCTFFTLGWIAERHGGLIRRMVEAGHEIASHGYEHRRATDQTAEEFRADVRRTKALLEDIGGVPVRGYRAASFSFDRTNPWVHAVLAEEGYRYSSSIYPVRHDHYGIPDAPRFPYRPDAARGVVELPLSTVRVLGRNLPCSGGGYFRLAPYRLSRWAIRQVNEADRQPAIFYCHPWELDPGQPRTEGLGAKTRFRHYVNLDRMEAKLGRLLADFSWDTMDSVFRPSGDGAP